MISQIRDGNERFEGFVFSTKNVSVLLFILLVLLGSFLPEILGAIVVTSVSGLLFIFVADRSSATQTTTLLTAAGGVFVALLMMIVAPKWSGGYSIARCFAIVGYLFIIPSMWTVIAAEQRAYQLLVIACRIYFILASFFVVISVISYGYGSGQTLMFGFHKNTIGLTLTPVSIVYIYSYSKLWKRIAASVCVFTILLLLFSKTSILVVAVMLAAMVIPPGACFTIAIGVFLLGYIYRDALFYSNELQTIYQRGLLVEEAWSEIVATSESFWYGLGPGNFSSRLSVFQLESLSSSHNALLDIWYAFGAFVFLYIVTYLVVLLVWFWSSKSVFGIAFLGFLAHSMFDVGWVRGPGFVAAVILGAALAETTNRRRRVESRHQPQAMAASMKRSSG